MAANADSNATRWLNGMREILAVAHHYRDANRSRLAPDFNAIRFLHNNENGLSTIIADLLDPQGSHGQGSVFLTAFAAEWLADWKLGSAECEGAKVGVEQKTTHIAQSNRRIDIHLRVGDGVIGIENKLWGAAEQRDQVQAYLAHLGKTGARHRLLYLTRDGSPPSEFSIACDQRDAAMTSRDGTPRTLMLMDASTLAHWVDRCARACVSERVSAFLRDLADYVRIDVLGENSMDEQTAIVKWATTNPENLAAAIEVINARSAIYGDLFKRFKGMLATELRKDVLLRTWHIDTSEDLDRRYGGITVRPTEGAAFGFRLQFEQGNGHDAVVGIVSSGDIPHNDRLEDVAKVLDGVLGLGKRSTVWPWYQSFEPREWGNDAEVLASILDPEESGLAAHAARQIAGISSALNNERLLERLR